MCFVSASGPGAGARGLPGKTKAGAGADWDGRGGCGGVEPVHCRARQA